LSPPRRREPPSLHGSLESFPFADVLSLLASTGNTGALEVTGDGAQSRLYVDGGAVVAAEGGRREVPVDVVVELLRLEQGDFAFAPDEVPERRRPPVAVPDLLAEARARLDEWYEIEAVLPSVEHMVVLAAEAPADEVVLSGRQWRALAAVGGGGQIGLLFDRLGDDELDALRLLKGLVDAGLLEVLHPVNESAEPPHLGVDRPEGAGSSILGAGEPSVDGPVIVVRAVEPPPRLEDPDLQARLDALGQQFDAVYEVAHAAAEEEAEVAVGHSSLLGKLLHRHDG
jgi:hypothetical protein